MQKVEKVILKNKMEVAFIFDNRFTTSSVQMNFKIGWRHDKKEYLGLAHLFEHLVGKRTKKFSGKSEFTHVLEKHGIESNAYTTGDHTAYYHNQTHENLLLSIEYLLEAIYQTTFNTEDLEMEKKVVMNERRDALDNDEHVLYWEVLRSLYPGTTLTQDMFGTPETMKNISLKEFEDFYLNYKNSKNSFLVVATNNSKQKKKLISFLNNYFTNKDFKKIEHSGERFKEIVEKETGMNNFSRINKPDRKQANLNIAYKLRKFNLKERMSFHVMRHILTGGFSGKIFKRLRDELGLTYSIRLWRDNFVGFDYSIFNCMCNKDEREKLIAEFDEVVDGLQNSLTQQDVEDVKEILLFRENRNQDPRSEIQAFVDSVILREDYLDSRTYKDMLSKVKIKDIKDIIKAVFNKNNRSICVLE